MPVGLQILSPSNELILDVTERVTKVIQIISKTPTAKDNSFTVSDPVFLDNAPFVHCHMGNILSENLNVQERFSCLYVNHSLNGQVLTINFGYNSDNGYTYSYKNPFNFIIGAY